MSSNLLKGRFTQVQQGEKRIIDVNALMEKRIEALGTQVKPTSDDKFTQGFLKGIQVLDTENLQADEELSGNVIKSGESLEKLHEEAQQEADDIIEQAKAEAENIIQETLNQAKREADNLEEQFKQKGYDAGYKQGMQEVEVLKQQLKEQSVNLETEYQKMVDELEPKFIDTLTGIYEHIFKVDLQSYREILIYLISDTIRRVESSREFLIHISKEDYPDVMMHRKQLVADAAPGNRTVEIIEDITLSKNQCLIETDAGIFDCGLGTQLEELRKMLILLSYEA